MMKVENMISKSSGKKVANQYIIRDDNKVTFQSYSSPIVEIDEEEKRITVYRDYDYSTTTGKYRNRFMESRGLIDMATKKGFEYYMNLGAIGNYDIVKAF